MNLKFTLFFLALITACINSSIAQWAAVGQGLDNYVWGSVVYDGELYACGNFEHADGLECLGIARWNGTEWHDVGGGFQHGAFTNVVRGLTVFNDELYAGGYVDSVSGMAIHKIAKWNGTSWSAAGSDCPISTVNCLLVYNGELYAGGEGSGAVKVCVAKWNGTGWTSLDLEGGTTDVWALASYNGDLYAGGVFSNFNGQNIGGVAKWDGTAWSDIGSGFTAFNAIRALAVFGNKLYIGGGFTTAGGVAANNIVSWDGTTWSPLNGGVNASVQSLLPYGDQLFVGGTYWMVDGITANRAASWDGASWTVLGEDLGAGARTQQVYNGSLYSLGEGAFNGQNFAAKWTGDVFSGIEITATNIAVNIFPNPATEMLQIEMPGIDFSKNITFRVVNVLGKAIKQIPLHSFSSTIEVSDIVPGIYLYEIKDDQHAIKTGRIIVE
jgi:hypothetical protein